MRKLNSSLARGIEVVLRTIAKAPVRIAILILVFGRLVGGSLVALCEHWKFFDGLWFGLVTQTTTGFGEFVPKTTLGRLFTEWLLMWPAVVATATLTGAVAGAIVAYKIEGHLGTEALDDDFDHCISQMEALKRRYVQKHLLDERNADA